MRARGQGRKRNWVEDAVLGRARLRARADLARGSGGGRWWTAADHVTGVLGRAVIGGGLGVGRGGLWGVGVAVASARHSLECRECQGVECVELWGVALRALGVSGAVKVLEAEERKRERERRRQE